MMKSNFFVYLAGPIAGNTFDEANEWRLYIESACSTKPIKFLSPMRNKEYLVNEGVLGPNSYPHKVLSTQSAILGRDKFDVMRADLLLVNFLGANRVSIGTCFEIAWAHYLHKPVIIVMEEDNPHQHLFVKACSTAITPSLEESVHLIDCFLAI